MRYILQVAKYFSAFAAELPHLGPGGKKRGRESFPSSWFAGIIYLMLPYSLTVMVTAGMAVMSLETVTVPSNMAFTRAL